MWHRATGGKVVASAAFALFLGTAFPANAQTLDQALASAYMKNPSLNSQRAATRATDEYVPIALSGYRPQIFGSGYAGQQWSESRISVSNTIAGGTVTNRSSLSPVGYGITIAQTVYDGLKTASSVRSAESQVKGQRELLRNTEQTVLLDAATAYMNVLQNAALLELSKQNLQAFQEELRATNDRFAVGEVTRTDVAQAQASVASAESQLADAEANLNTARAVFYQVIGLQPVKLSPGKPIDNLLPRTQDLAISQGLGTHPAVKAAEYSVDAALQNVKVAESALSPTLTLNGSAGQDFNNSSSVERSTSASVGLNLSVPIYQGGGEFANIRQSKELLGQQRIRCEPRPGARQCGAVLGCAGRRQVGHPVGPGFGGGERDRAQGRARGMARRPAHHAGRAAADHRPVQRPRHAGGRPARPGGGFVRAALGLRQPELQVARPQGEHL